MNADFHLIETLLWDGTKPLRAARHLARMARGAAALGWAFDPDEAEVLLQRGPAPERLRLALYRDRLELTTGPAPAPMAQFVLALSRECLSSADPWLIHKTSQRAAYDAARAAMPEGASETLLCNERGEICEGSITTLFFDRGQGLRTPPVSCGLLAGILREELLASGAAKEELLLPRDLPHVRLWCGNALRGLVPAVLHPTALEDPRLA